MPFMLIGKNKRMLMTPNFLFLKNISRNIYGGQGHCDVEKTVVVLHEKMKTVLKAVNGKSITTCIYNTNPRKKLQSL